MGEEASLWALFVSSFLAATLLPGGSEAVLYAVLRFHPGEYWTALAVATAGNTLGGMSSWLIGRLIARARPLPGLAAVQKYGAPVLVFSGTVEERAVADAAARGARGFLGKPFDLQQLIDQAKQIAPV